MKENDNGIKMPLTTQRKILIAVDLEKNSEHLIMYSVVVTKRILCEYTLIYCHKNDVVESEDAEKVNLLLQKAKEVHKIEIKSVFEQAITGEEISKKVTELHRIEKFDTIVIGTSNSPHSWKMGRISTQILRKVVANILVVPPAIHLSFPHQTHSIID